MQLYRLVTRTISSRKQDVSCCADAHMDSDEQHRLLDPDRKQHRFG